MSYNIQSQVRAKFASVAAMLAAASSLAIGEEVETVAYYDDWASYLGRPEGGAKYIKLSGQANTEDGYNFIYTSDGNTLARVEGTGETPEAAGCRGDDTADDTVGMQTLWNSVKRPQLTAGKTYLATNLTIPVTDGWGLDGKGAIIKKLTGDDNYYLVAASKHVNNIAEAQEPIDVIDVVFDGNNIATHPLIIQNWNSYIEAECKNGLKAGCLFAAETRDGTAFPTSSLVNTKFLLKSHHNGGCGLYVKDAARNNATDGYVLAGSYFYNNADYAAYIESGAGWDVHCNTYANGAGVGFNGYGKGTRVHDCFIDDGDGVVAALPETGQVYSGALYCKTALGVNVIGLLRANGNTFHGPVSMQGNGDSAPYGILSTNNTYDEGAYIYHQYFGAGRKIVSKGDTFKDADPLRWDNGSSPGQIIVENGYLVDSDKIITGRFVAGDDYKNSELAWTYGEVYGGKSENVTAGGAFSFDYEIPPMKNYDQRTGTVMLVTRANHNSSIRVEYVGMVSVKAKINGTQAWVVSLTDIVYTAGEWTTKIAATVADAGDDTGTLTLAGEPSDTDGYGKVVVQWK